MKNGQPEALVEALDILHAAWADLLAAIDAAHPWIKRSFLWVYAQLPPIVWITVWYTMLAMMMLAPFFPRH